MELRNILEGYRVAPAECRTIAGAFRLQTHEPGEDVLRQGEPSDAFYFIRSGVAIVIRTDEGGDQELGVLKEGEFFGEVGLLEDAERTATVRAASRVEVYRLERDAFARFMGDSRAFDDIITRIGRRRLLQQSLPFRELDTPELDAVAALLAEKPYPAGAVVFHENDPADAMYLIAKGRVKVTQHTRWGKEVAVAWLEQGDVFGELGLIEPNPRSATVSVSEDASLLELSARDFEKLVADNPRVSLGMLKMLVRRTRETSRRMSQTAGRPLFKGITILCRPERCLSCRACEIACAVAKSASRNLHDAIRETPTPVRRIHIRRTAGSGPEAVIRPEHCLQCRDAPCIAACKLKAIRRDPTSGTVVITEKCVGCGLCLKACRYGVISLIRSSSGKRVALKCTHCAELPSGPACVRSCPTNALVIALPAMSSGVT